MWPVLDSASWVCPDTLIVAPSLPSTGLDARTSIRRQLLDRIQVQQMLTKRFLWMLAAGTIIAVTSPGCVVTRFYNPGPKATYFWVPGVGEWPINDPHLDRDNKTQELESVRVDYQYGKPDPHGDLRRVARSCMA